NYSRPLISYYLGGRIDRDSIYFKKEDFYRENKVELILEIIAESIDIENREMQETKARLIRILAKHTGQTEEKIKQDTERNFYMSAEEAVKYGIVDGILEFKKKI
ncbi:MAG: ATP-dependent Clp protease proteolytic subunit, partial [Elusimicrobiales bacterium]|nr:ATP-dependent Clp protease proteolytic subunit [Elusimicrobiales bacterium]